MNLLEQFEIIQKKFRPSGQPGSVENIFQIYEHSAKDVSGFLPIIIKPTPEEKKVKKSIN